MTRRCAWCKKITGQTEDDEEGITDGICPSCLTEYFPSEAAQILGGHYEHEPERFYQVASGETGIA